MKLKNFLKIFFTFSFLLVILSTTFALDCNQDNVGMSEIINDELCICQESVVHSNTGAQINEFTIVCDDGNFQSQTNSVQDTEDIETNSVQDTEDIETTSLPNTEDMEAEIYSQVNQNSDCKEKINSYNIQISKYLKEFNEFSNIIKKLSRERIQLKKQIQEYRTCKVRVVQLNSQNRGNIMTGNISLNKNDDVFANILTKDSSMATVMVESNIGTDNNEYDTDFIENIENEIEVFLNDIEEEIIEIDQNEVDNNSTVMNDCLSIKKNINKNKDNIKNILIEIRQFKEKHKESLQNLNELRKKRNDLVKECFPKTEDIINEKCEVPKELEQKRNELEKSLKNQKYIIERGVGSQTDLEVDYNNLYKKSKIEYQLVLKKIELIRKECMQKNKISQDIQNLCDDKIEILKEKEKIKNKILQTTDIDELYKLNRNLEYIDEKFNNTVCIQLDEKPYESSQGNPPIHSNAVDACIKNLIERDNVTEEIASYACKNKFNQQQDNYNQKIKELENKINDQEKQIKLMQNKMLSLQEKLNNATKEEKIEFIKENSEDIKLDSIKKIDKKIIYLQKTIQEIDFLDTNLENKDELINSLNKQIASLELAKENISNAETLTEFKENINKAREYDLNAKRVNAVSLIRKDLVKLYDILNKYFADHKDYDELKSELDSIELEITSLDMDKISSEKAQEIKNRYTNYKQKLRSYVSDEVNTE